RAGRGASALVADVGFPLGYLWRNRGDEPGLVCHGRRYSDCRSAIRQSGGRRPHIHGVPTYEQRSSIVNLSRGSLWIWGGILSAPNAAIAAGPAAAELSQLYAVHCGHLVDVEAGRLLGATTVVIDGKRIKEVTLGSQHPVGATEVDLLNATCLPG